MSGSPQVVKGRFTRLMDGDYRSFSLNPNDLSDTHGYNYPKATVGGASHPMIQAGSGKSRIITFTLRLDADIGYRLKRRNQNNTGVTKDRGGYGRENAALGQVMSVADELAWYEHFTYPVGNARLGEQDAFPPVLLFSFGERYQGTPCVMLDHKANVLQWSPTLSPVRADISLTLEYKMIRRVIADNIYLPSRNRNF